MNTTTAPIKQLQFWGDVPSHTVVILISGKARAGKTTLANQLRPLLEADGHDVTIESFANKVKECAKEFYGWDGQKDKKGRKLLQNVGRTGREYNDNLWVEYVVSHILDYVFAPSFVLIDDWRYPNELIKMGENQEFITIPVRVIRPDAGLTGELGLDDSETALTDEYPYEFFIYNDGSLVDLANKAKDLIDYIYSL